MRNAIRRSRTTARLAMAAAVPGLAACDRGTTEPVMSRDVFIDVVVALREAARAAETPEAFEARKEALFASAGVSDSLLLAYQRSLATPAELAELWRAVNERLVAAEQRDAGEGDPGGEMDVPEDDIRENRGTPSNRGARDSEIR